MAKNPRPAASDAVAFTAATHPITLKSIRDQAERATSIVAQARGHMLAPESRKAAPTFSATQLIDRLGLERSQYEYRVRHPNGLPTGRLSATGARREFSLAEMREWARQYRVAHLRPEGAEAITISTAHFKGGSSKTTTATTLAQGLSMRGHRVLVVDVDPQGSMTTLFGFLPDAEVDLTQTLMPLFSGDATDLAYAIRPTYWDGIDLIPACSSLFSAEFLLPTRQLKEKGFQFWRAMDFGLDPLRTVYDVIICDTPPSLSFLTVNALMASDGIVMPLPPNNLDFASSAQFWDLFKDLADDFSERGAGKDFAFINVLLSKVKYAAPKDNTGQSTSIIREWIQAAYAERVLPVEIPDVEAVRTASKEFGTVYDASRDNASTRTFKSAFEAYDRFVDLIEQQMETFWRRQVGG
ncbi:MAG TPA: AAA family ATPase [Aquabacterium sp.]|nr:AAA family ATPase [Aquabacterium sp.]HQC96730.1 AAA family ATPase [Aquabacterium sp.]